MLIGVEAPLIWEAWKSYRALVDMERPFEHARQSVLGRCFIALFPELEEIWFPPPSSDRVQPQSPFVVYSFAGQFAFISIFAYKETGNEL